MSQAASISGTVSYRERMALTPQARLIVSLQDVSRADARATTLAEKEIGNPGPVPIAFELEYDPADIDQRMSYAIRAEIHDQNRMLFTTDTHTPVLTRGAGDHVDMMLVRINQPTVSPPQAPPAMGGMALEGMFRYMADAALFRDCRDGKSYPVAMEGAYIELERAYMESAVEAGQEVMVRLTGRLLERPAMEGDRNEVKLIVDAFNEIIPDAECEPVTHADLQNTYWKLLEIEGQAVAVSSAGKQPHLILSTAESQAKGNGGCNNFFGNYELDGEKLNFGVMASTMMACPDGMDTERNFHGVLEQTTRFEISGLFLELYNEDQLLARFVAIYF